MLRVKGSVSLSLWKPEDVEALDVLRQTDVTFDRLRPEHPKLKLLERGRTPFFFLRSVTSRRTRKSARRVRERIVYIRLLRFVVRAFSLNNSSNSRENKRVLEWNVFSNAHTPRRKQSLGSRMWFHTTLLIILNAKQEERTNNEQQTKKESTS